MTKRSKWALAALLGLTTGASGFRPAVCEAAPGGERRPVCGFTYPTPPGCRWELVYVEVPCLNDPSQICYEAVCNLNCGWDFGWDSF